MDFLSRIKQAAPLDIDEELFDLSKQFKEKFGKAVPREMMPPSVTDDKLKEAIKSCLESGDGDILKLLGVQIKNDVLY